MSDRHAPIARYRIHRSDGGGQGESIYTDDRATAVAWSQKPGVVVDAYVYGIGWQNINKVAEASE